MPAMPYSMEKGPYLSVIEDFVNGDQTRAASALEGLRNGDPIADIGALDHPIPGSPYTPADLKKHINRDWFGLEPTLDASGSITGWQQQKAFDPAAHPSSGYWLHWYGEPEQVFREALVRALEVSLGLLRPGAPGTTGKAKPTRHWPVDLFWSCPHPWYEAWVSWRAQPQAKTGQVTVILNSPAHQALADSKGEHHSGELLNSPIRPPSTASSRAMRPYEVDPDEATGRQGLWVVSQTYHQSWTPTPGSYPTPPGEWRPPTLGAPIRSLGPVVTVAIAEIEGGVLPDGRPYVPATP